MQEHDLIFSMIADHADEGAVAVTHALLDQRADARIHLFLDELGAHNRCALGRGR